MRKLRHVATKAVCWAILATATWRPAWRSDVRRVFSGARLETNCPQKSRATGKNTSETKAENSSRGLASSWGNARDPSWQQQLQQRNQRKSVAAVIIMTVLIIPFFLGLHAYHHYHHDNHHFLFDSLGRTMIVVMTRNVLPMNAGGRFVITIFAFEMSSL